MLGAVVLYASSAEARGSFRSRTGQKRRSAHPDADDPVIQRLHASGQPIIVVIDDNPLHRAQDFTDLQRNAKPLSSSLGLSMDRRQPVNQLLIKLVRDPATPRPRKASWPGSGTGLAPSSPTPR